MQWLHIKCVDYWTLFYEFLTELERSAAAVVANRYRIVPGRVLKSSGSGLLIYQTSGSGSIGFTKKSNVRVRVSDFGFIGFVGFRQKICVIQD